LNVIAKDAAALAERFAPLGAPDWLSAGRAFDICFAVGLGATVPRVRELARGIAADINIVPLAGRRKRLLIADMDSTIINVEVVDELADFAHVKDKVAAITARAVAGEIEFEQAVRERVALLHGLSLDRMHRVYAERIRLHPGAEALVAT